MQRDLSHRCYMEVPRIKKVKSACPIKSVVKQKIGEPKNLYKIRALKKSDLQMQFWLFRLCSGIIAIERWDKNAER